MKLLFALMLSCVASGAFADDAPGVVERLSCAEITTRVSELGAIAEPSEEESAELAKLKADYRRTCVQSARGRRVSAGRVVVEGVSDDVVPDEIEEEVVEIDAVPVQETEPVAEVDPTIALEQELANLDAGLCADGGAPNKFGCCGDEIFKDLGNTVFACCPRDGNGDCFPPLK